ncbi:hypothetical protein M434DRAFT_34173 [Hypoxylon sp. CO27-5]|nr:hypothetical protein M434DRAFT_34173 [Hypoxylon sp. CO27-5]
MADQIDMTYFLGKLAESTPEGSPMDPRRVFFLSVLDVVQKYIAHEFAEDDGKRERRAARSQRQNRVTKRRRESSPTPRQSSNKKRRVATTTANPKRTSEERQASISREIRDSDPVPPPQLPASQPAYELADYEALADKYESLEPDAKLVETRGRIRADPGLSDMCKIVLILTTQIPPGFWTTYETIQHHLIKMGRGCTIDEISEALAENPFGDAVPCHRVIDSGGGFGKLMDLGSHYDDQEQMLGLLEEGFQIMDGGCAGGTELCEFVGCPRV